MTYKRYANILKWLSFVLLVYVVTAFMVGGDVKSILYHSFIPSISFSKESLILICAFLGTSITPYIFFWQTSQEVEEEVEKGKTTLKLRTKEVDKKELKDMRVDVVSGMFFSQIAAFFIVLTCAEALWKNGITNITSAQDAALALKPLVGEYAYLLFTLGIVGTGLLAIPVLAGSAAYCVSEALGAPFGLDRKLKNTYTFYGVIMLPILIGFTLNLFNLDVIKILIYSAVVNGLVAPVILAFIVLITSNRKLMGEHSNHTLITFFGWITVVIMSVSAIAAIISLF
jgi:Mn2+/Fe2+ NRAMP family transporter